MIDAESSPMFRHILLATDGSQQAERAVTHALALAKSLGAKVTAVTATDMIPTGPYAPIPWPSGIDRYEAAAAASANLILNRVVAAAETQDVVCEARHVADQPAAEAIIATAEQQRCDLIVMGACGRHGLARLMLGSQANRVVTLSRIPVLVCR
jgi:nucleotide-binding universal stress UspA family protein